MPGLGLRAFFRLRGLVVVYSSGFGAYGVQNQALATLQGKPRVGRLGSRLQAHGRSSAACILGVYRASACLLLRVKIKGPKP